MKTKTLAAISAAVSITVAPAAVTLTMPTAAAATCPSANPGPPPGAAQRPIGSVSGGADPDTLWIAAGRTHMIGISTADGGEIGPVQVQTPSPLWLSALVVDAADNGAHQLLVNTGREVQLFVIEGCQIQQVVHADGKPFLLDTGHRMGRGDGIGCSDLGDGRHLVQLFPQLQDDQWTVQRTQIDLDGTTGSLGQSDIVTATSAEDPTVTTAHMISCGDLTMVADGVDEPLR